MIANGDFRRTPVWQGLVLSVLLSQGSFLWFGRDYRAYRSASFVQCSTECSQRYGIAIRYSGTRLLRRDRQRERPFYGSCNRVRLSASGWLHGCLSSSKSHYLGDILAQRLA
ncbi:hypothetical protein BFW90_11460 [Pseudomonas fluorescens]|nr:hypothetical protein BFW90_11460 [Pseudomonas fluorescens]